MRNKIVVIVWFLSVFISFDLSAQDAKKDTISGDFINITFNEFVRRVESNTSFKFYYSSEAGDSINVNIEVSDKHINDVLALIFVNTKYFFAVDHRRNIFISEGAPVETFISGGIIERNDGESRPNEIIERAQKISGLIENKFLEIGRKGDSQSGKVTLYGKIYDGQTGNALGGVTLSVDGRNEGAVSDQSGVYSITLPQGTYTIRIRSLGMKETRRNVVLYSDGALDIGMEQELNYVDEIVVTGKENTVKSLEMGQEKVSIKTIKQTPTVFGEADVLRVIMTLPGVKTSGEASTGFNVRGGSADQNLILYNDAIIYNPSHLFGFFSAFNPDVVKNVELYKSSIPAKFGGRLSSVLDVATRTGNMNKFAGNGGLGILTGRLTIEGPIIKNKTSFILGGRSTYSNWLLSQLRNSTYSGSKASFYDLNLVVSHILSSKSELYLTGYVSQDKFNLKKTTLFDYNNNSIVLKWRYNYSDKLSTELTGSTSGYQYGITNTETSLNAYKLSFGINQMQLKGDVKYAISPKHNLTFGLSSLHYNIQPGKISPEGQESLVAQDKIQNEQALESAIYLGDQYQMSARLGFDFGVRFSLFNYLGPKDIHVYQDRLPRSVYSMSDTISYQGGKNIKTYLGPEFRLSGRYMITDNVSVKIGYNTLRQYIHMLSNTATISPTDIWKLSDPNIKPTTGDQISLGLYKNIRKNTIEASVELYRKRMKNYLDYRAGAKLIQNHHVETEVVSTEGNSYGAEFLVKKNNGKLNGWVSYTYSRIFLRMNDPSQGELVNNGKWYPANFDKPHDFTFVGNYKFSRRFSTSLNCTYSTGRPVTLPIATYNMAGGQRIVYGDRNQYRIPDYFRIDLSLNIEGNHKIKKLSHSSWTIAVYNLTGRKNVYSVYFTNDQGKIQGYKLSIFGQPIPTITYNFRF
ncbi:TonB-dependent receptor [Sporocytophaga myxococcoides]|uniref:TonB-dependent receptor n=1 Tax=Sporocytophaga myxococcoides TaxID=153721 RepID=UPI0004213293|nr:carboxypeptidase-like regulatory domain-containing protein [Sporocytophaga myxococcoides]